MLKRSFFLFVLLFTQLPAQLSAQLTSSYVAGPGSVTLYASVAGMGPLYSPATMLDDGYSAAYPIGFTFNYYGTDYTQCLIGSNGTISFNLASAGGYAPWPITGPLLGNSSAPNSICGAWCDMLVMAGSTINYSTMGSAPNRKFIVNFCSVPMYSCTTEHTTSTIIIYETSNLIDVYVGHHTACAWNNGRAIVGVQNASLTSATVAPGRDYPVAWSATNEAYRFSPSGSSYTVSSIPYSSVIFPSALVSINWYDNSGAYVGSGSPLTIYPTAPGNYTATAVACLDTVFSNTLFVIPCTGVPDAGVAHSNTATACSTSMIALTDSGYSTSAALQWQSSVDSTSWADIAGATLSSHIFSGLSSTTYFRCKAFCSTGGEAFSAGIKVSYNPICPCVLTDPGTVSVSAPAACATAPLTLDATSYITSGVSRQWQSSADSSLWTNIAGAVTLPYTFSGLSSTTYYRLAFTCVSSGVSIVTAGKKVIHTPLCLCTGMPASGTATSSTAYCSTCFLTLGLAGASTDSGLIYQWQLSEDGMTAWTNIIGATTVPYIYTPSGAYYYRCNISCTASGLSSSSGSVHVLYQYSIIRDTISSVADTVCGPARFYVQVNGLSSFLTLKTFYGDGTNETVPLISSGPLSGATSYAVTEHYYPFPGTNSIKHVIYCNAIPQDSLSYNYEQHYCKTLPVKLYTEVNLDCIKNTNEMYNSMPVSIRVDSNGMAVDTLSATSGIFYKAYAPTGTIYNFSVIAGSSYVICPVSGTESFTITPTVNTYPVKYLGLSCSGATCADLGVHAMTQTGNFQQLGYLYVSNGYCFPADAILTLNYSYKFNSGFSSPILPSTHSGHIATWNLAGITATGFPVERGYTLHSWPMLSIGDTVVTEISLTTIGGDCDTTNNHIVIVDTVKIAYDPNFIEAMPAGCFDTTTQFQYDIHFENVGNDTARNVYVLDTLSPYVDSRTLKIVMATAVMNTSISKDGGYTIVRFDFPGINLLDSAHHGLNDGALIYTIEAKPDMAMSSSIISRAGIYFDDNDVVMTNRVENRKGCPEPSIVAGGHKTGITELFPNPATDELYIRSSAITYTSLTITNSIGQVVMQKAISTAQTKLNIQALPVGVYYVSLMGAEGRQVQKFVKW